MNSCVMPCLSPIHPLTLIQHKCEIFRRRRFHLVQLSKESEQSPLCCLSRAVKLQEQAPITPTFAGEKGALLLQIQLWLKWWKQKKEITPGLACQLGSGSWKHKRDSGQGLRAASDTCKSSEFSLGHRMLRNSSSQEATAPVNISLSPYYRCTNSHVYL